MPKEHISLPRVRRMLFSSVVKARNFVYTSGHTGSRDTEGNPLTIIQEQIRQSFINLKRALNAAGVTFDDAVKATVFLKKMEDFGEMNGVYRSFCGENLPARSTLVTDLVADSILVEIELVLYKE